MNLSDYVTDETVVLAFQHYIVMLGTTVLIANTLVPPMGGDAVCFVFWFLDPVVEYLFYYMILKSTVWYFER